MRLNNFLTLLIICVIFITSCHSTTKITSTEKSVIESTITESILSPKPSFIYKNQIFNTQIKTLLCHKKEEELSLPIINLKSEEQLLISFDDLEADIKDYYYTIIHCNSDWTESELMYSEYTSGFTDKHITNYESSFNTLQKYTHYSFKFPTIDMKPILSGNYIFKIFEDGGNTIAYKRFMILENKIEIEAKVRRATLAENRNTKHEIDFTIKHPRLLVSDPFSDIKVTIKQNNQENNAITNLTPLFVKNDELIYDYEDDNIFFGNNEFRYFDIKSLRYQSERIKKITHDSIYNHVYLFNDPKRSFTQYSIQPDINGNFLIKSQEASNSAIEADYAFVHFTLPFDSISYGDLYLLGSFSDWELKKSFKLYYNKERKQYEGDLYLKQGYYNYHYALEDISTNRVDVSFIEGTHYQTRNDYYIYVYHRAIGDRYDRFIGFLKTSSKELF